MTPTPRRAQRHEQEASEPCQVTGLGRHVGRQDGRQDRAAAALRVCRSRGGCHRHVRAPAITGVGNVDGARATRGICPRGTTGTTSWRATRYAAASAGTATAARTAIASNGATTNAAAATRAAASPDDSERTVNAEAER